MSTPAQIPIDRQFVLGPGSTGRDVLQPGLPGRMVSFRFRFVICAIDRMMLPGIIAELVVILGANEWPPRPGALEIRVGEIRAIEVSVVLE